MSATLGWSDAGGLQGTKGLCWEREWCHPPATQTQQLRLRRVKSVDQPNQAFLDGRGCGSIPLTANDYGIDKEDSELQEGEC